MEKYTQKFKSQYYKNPAVVGAIFELLNWEVYFSLINLSLFPSTYRSMWARMFQIWFAMPYHPAPAAAHSLTYCFCHFTWLEQWTLCGWDTRGRRRASAFTFISRWIHLKFVGTKIGDRRIITIWWP